MNRWLLSLMAITLTALVFTFFPNKLMAQGKAFSNVIPFSTNAGRVGFFDQSNGKVYIYDNDLSTCVFSGQMHDLGGSIQKLSSRSSITTTGSTY
jgi:hypothetical protein